MRPTDTIFELTKSFLTPYAEDDPPPPKCAHVVFEAKAKVVTLWCTHCDFRYSPAMPIPVRLLSSLTRAFIEDHEKCEAPKVDKKGSGRGFR